MITAAIYDAAGEPRMIIRSTGTRQFNAQLKPGEEWREIDEDIKNLEDVPHKDILAIHPEMKLRTEQ